MEHEQLMRDVRREALARMEDAARTAEDFDAVVKQWDKLDENRERKERAHEMGRDDKTLDLGYTDGLIIPVPVDHPAWRLAIKGDFIDVIYDNAEEMWQLVEDWDIAAPMKDLTEKRKIVLFLSAVRLCTPQQIACYKDQTDRAVRKLLTDALHSIHKKLAPVIRKQIKAGAPDMTLNKRLFLEWYEQQKIALDKDKSKK